ncbi:YafY family protein [Paenibacillus sp. FSL H7-0357]|uniref:helix-turn-helix transcriptional regulator n=1 Tax=Paenibacillus sp. FSL H7-0357 TaxID=1536774 RepID=UPI00068C89E1|nr:YafY family protein [Paenibacillus sp. FSL H7-0357]
MKINRLLGIVVYLLNREVVSARALADKFEVSSRTIQRDIESIGLAGIPVGSLQGTNGGYYILDSFKMNRQLLQSEDYAYILAALKGLVSGYSSRRAEDTMEKIMSLTPEKEAAPQPIQLDLGVLREGAGTGEAIQVIEHAIRQKKVIHIQYTNARNEVADRNVEPLLLTYKWYAWYLFAYCCDHCGYRLFRLSRIRELRATDGTFSTMHRDAESLLAEAQDHRPYITVKLACPAGLRVLMEELLPNAVLIEVRDQELVMGFTVPEEENGWFGTLLLYGHQLTVLEPPSLRQRMADHASNLLNKYAECKTKELALCKGLDTEK